MSRGGIDRRHIWHLKSGTKTLRQLTRGEHVFPDEIHAYLLHRSWVTAYALTADFFNRHLNHTPGK